jgi:replicative DNA helicase
MLERIILKNLSVNENYLRKVIPFVQPEYFQDSAEKIVFKSIVSFVQKYNSLPTKEALELDISEQTGLGEEDHKRAVAIVRDINNVEENDLQWLLDETEKFCQDKAIQNAIMDSIHILEGKHKSKTKNNIPEILSDALGISFDSNIGHDFIENYEERYEYYHRVEEKVPFDIELLNKITRGGVSKKSLSIILAGTGVGKTLAMTHFAAANLSMGKNVLYITLEMAEEKIAERIDANLLNITIPDLTVLPRDLYERKISKLRENTQGKLIIKEYPTATAHVGHFRHLLNELNLKKNFIPDIIYIDYLNICMSSRIKQGSNVNSYTYIKSIAEELRGMSVEKNVPIISATQTTRSGYTNSDPGLEDTSESFGLPATADFMIAMVRSEELDDLNQILIKQLKNRYSDPSINKRFVIGVDRTKMRLYDCEQSAQSDVSEDKPLMDKTGFGKRQNEEDQMEWATRTMGRKDFSKFNFE